MGAKIVGVSYNNADIRYKNACLYLRLKPGRWIRMCCITLGKLKREANKQGFIFTVEKKEE